MANYIDDEEFDSGSETSMTSDQNGATVSHQESYSHSMLDKDEETAMAEDLGTDTEVDKRVASDTGTAGDRFRDEVNNPDELA